MRRLFFLLLLLSPLDGVAQNIEKFILTPNIGSYYTASRQTADQGMLMGGTSSDYAAGNYYSILTRYDAAGNFLWSSRLAQPYGRLFLSVKEAPWGDIYTAGYTPETPVAFEDGFVLRLDASGNYISKTFIGSIKESCDDIEFTSDHSVYACGYGNKNYNGTYYPDLAYLFKADSAMNVKWKISYDNIFSNQTYFHQVQLLQDGNLLVGGWIQTGASRELLLMKTDTSGTVLWSKTYNRLQSNYENFVDFRELNTGEIVVFGDDNFNFFGLKVLSNGDPVWMKSWKSDFRISDDDHQSSTLSNGNFMLCATGYDTSNFNKGVMMLEVDTAGNFVNAFLAGPVGFTHRKMVAEVIGTDTILMNELLYMPLPSAKYFSFQVVYPPDPLTDCDILPYAFNTQADSFSFNSAVIDTVYYPLLIWKQAAAGNFITQTDSAYCTYVGLDETVAHGNVSLFPNPASDFINLNYNFTKPLLLMELTDMQGKRQIVDVIQNNDSNLLLNIRHLSPGCYVLKIISETTATTIKFAKL